METKNYKVENNLFYFIVYIMILQLGSWQADSLNHSWERFGASELCLIYVYLYLPNVMVMYLSPWLWPWLQQGRRLFSLPSCSCSGLLMKLPISEIVSSSHSDRLSALLSFGKSKKPFQIPFRGNESTNLGILQRLLSLVFLQILRFSLSALLKRDGITDGHH